MIELVMYGMIPSANNGELRERAAREQLQEAEDAPVLGFVLQLLDRRQVDAGHRDVRAQPIDGQHHQCEQDLVPEVGTLNMFLRLESNGTTPFQSAGERG